MSELLREGIRQAFERLPVYLGEHVLISVVSLGLGIGISLPLAVAATRSRTLRWPLLTAASLVQTIPSLALLALFYPVLLGLAFVARTALGIDFSALGFLPTVLALTLYSMLPIVRNTVTGILGVDPPVVEAARGMGMTPRQMLFRVELPLAAPVVIAGIRTATVWVVGIATLSTPVGQTSLGNYIFTGLQTENWIFVLFGCFWAAALALVLDQLIALAESAASERSRLRAVLAGGGLLLVVGAALWPWGGRSQPDYVIGAKTFEEQLILASLIEGELERAGAEAARREGLGSVVIFRALAAGDIDAYVDYTGTIWANHMEREETADRETVLREVARWLEREHGIAQLGPLGFENAYGLAMRRERADALGIRTIADLAAHAPSLSIGGDYEFFGRPEWRRIREAYGLRFAARRQYQSTFMYRAVADDEVDVISAFTSDGRIAAYDLLVLGDPRQVIPPYDAVLLLAPGRSEDERLRGALLPLVGAIDVEAMRRANLLVYGAEGREEHTPRQAAAWLRERVLGGGGGNGAGALPAPE